MVECNPYLDNIFGSLADPTRRDILRRVSQAELTISEIACKYDLTFSAVSKHLKVLEAAHLINKRRRGKEQLVHIAPKALAEANQYLDWYKQVWDQQLDSLENYLNKGV